MNTVSNTGHFTERERSALQILQYLAPASVTAAAMMAFAVLPRELGGVPFTAAAVLFTIFNILTRRLPRSPSRLRGWGVVYVVALFVVMASSLTLEWLVVRQGNTPWLPWILASVVFAFIASGAWIIESRTTNTTASAA
jgi:hypothetical protein